MIDCSSHTFKFIRREISYNEKSMGNYNPNLGLIEHDSARDFSVCRYLKFSTYDQMAVFWNVQ